MQENKNHIIINFYISSNANEMQKLAVQLKLWLISLNDFIFFFFF